LITPSNHCTASIDKEQALNIYQKVIYTALLGVACHLAACTERSIKAVEPPSVTKSAQAVFIAYHEAYVAGDYATMLGCMAPEERDEGRKYIEALRDYAVEEHKLYESVKATYGAEYADKFRRTLPLEQWRIILDDQGCRVNMADVSIVTKRNGGIYEFSPALGYMMIVERLRESGWYFVGLCASQDTLDGMVRILNGERQRIKAMRKQLRLGNWKGKEGKGDRTNSGDTILNYCNS
jgi:hypothetical protein